MKIAFAFLLCAFVCTAYAAPSARSQFIPLMLSKGLSALSRLIPDEESMVQSQVADDTDDDPIARAERFELIKRLGGKLVSKLKDQICGSTAPSAPAVLQDDDDDAQMAAILSVPDIDNSLIQSLQQLDDAEIEGFLSSIKNLAKKALPYAKKYGKKSLPYLKEGLNMLLSEPGAQEMDDDSFIRNLKEMNDAEMEGFLDTLKHIGKKALPYVKASLPYVKTGLKTGLNLLGKKK